MKYQDYLKHDEERREDNRLNGVVNPRIAELAKRRADKEAEKDAARRAKDELRRQKAIDKLHAKIDARVK
jgi:hypothetical protein